MDNSTNQSQVTRSSFVTTLAWIFIFFSGFTTLIAILQNIMVNLMFPTEQMQATMHAAKGGPEIPVFAEFMLNHFRLLVATFLVMSVATLTTSIALLKRQNWARLVFIGLMGLGIAWNLAGLFLQYAILPAMPFPPDAPSEFQSHFETMTTIIRIFADVMIIGFSALFIWIITRLVSPEIRKEFDPGLRP